MKDFAAIVIGTIGGIYLAAIVLSPIIAVVALIETLSK